MEKNEKAVYYCCCFAICCMGLGFGIYLALMPANFRVGCMQSLVRTERRQNRQEYWNKDISKRVDMISGVIENQHKGVNNEKN